MELCEHVVVLGCHRNLQRSSADRICGVTWCLRLQQRARKPCVPVVGCKYEWGATILEREVGEIECQSANAFDPGQRCQQQGCGIMSVVYGGTEGEALQSNVCVDQ